MAKKIVIVGGVAAGPKAACRIKRLLADAEVTIIDEDSLISYGGCGIPYYISGDVADEKELRSTNFHMVRDEYFFNNTKGVRTLTSTRALAIDRKNKFVEIEDLKEKQKSRIDYDFLLLATGSKPMVLPVPGSNADGVFTISDMHKAIAIKDRIAKGQVERAVVIGGGAIGIEMAEALTDLWGIETSLVEYASQLLPGIIDWPLAAMLEKHLSEHGIKVFTGEPAEEIVMEDGRAAAVRTRERTLPADLVIMAAGVRPRSELAAAAGLLVAPNGGIEVNQRMQTSDPDIFAAGDCVSLPHLISGKPVVAPFGSMANKEGRVAADNMAGIPTIFKGALGSFILKAFEMSIGSVGLSLERARAEGFDADCSFITPSDRAHFFPGQDIMCLEMIFDRRTRKVLGLQGAGPMNDALSARIDTAAAALANDMSLDDFANIEMAYAPPFSTAIDPINAVAYVADNLCDKRMRQLSLKEFCDWTREPASRPDWLVLDVRHEQQALPLVEKLGTDLWISLPYDQVREKYDSLPKDKFLIVFCNAGSRSFEVQVFLDSVGIKNNTVLPGGFNAVRRIGGMEWFD